MFTAQIGSKYANNTEKKKKKKKKKKRIRRRRRRKDSIQSTPSTFLKQKNSLKFFCAPNL
jgi:hypothetical protein